VHHTPLDAGGREVWLQLQDPAEVLNGEAGLAQRQVDGTTLEKRQVVVGITLCRGDIC